MSMTNVVDLAAYRAAKGDRSEQRLIVRRYGDTAARVVPLTPIALPQRRGIISAGSSIAAELPTTPPRG